MRTAYLSFLHPHKSPGGQQLIAYELFGQARERHGGESSLFIAGDFERAMRGAESSQVMETGAGEFVYFSPGFDFRFFTNYDIAGQLELARLLESFQPDVIHFHHFLAFGLDLVPLLRRRLPRTRMVFTFHEFLGICHNNGHLLRNHDGGICSQVQAVRCQQCFPGERLDYFVQRKEFMNRMFAQFDALSTVSEFARRTLAANLDLRQEIRVIANGPIGDAAAVRKRSSLPPRLNGRRYTIGYVGQVHRTKGVELLLRAATELAKDGAMSDKTLGLAIYGNAVDRAYQASLQPKVAEAKSHGVEVELKGPYAVEAIASVLGDVDVVVIPSLWPESYALTVDEAVLAGKYVICARMPSVGERLAETSSFAFFEMGSVADLKRALLTAFERIDEAGWKNPFKAPFISWRDLYDSYDRRLYRA